MPIRIKTVKQAEKVYQRVRSGVTVSDRRKVAIWQGKYDRNPTATNKEKYIKSLTTAFEKSSNYNKIAPVIERQQLTQRFGEVRRRAKGYYENNKDLLEELNVEVSLKNNMKEYRNETKLTVYNPHSLDYKVKNKLKFLTNEEIIEETMKLEEYIAKNKSATKNSESRVRALFKDMTQTFVDSLANMSGNKAALWKDRIIQLIQMAAGYSDDDEGYDNAEELFNEIIMDLDNSAWEYFQTYDIGMPKLVKKRR